MKKELEDKKKDVNASLAAHKEQAGKTLSAGLTKTKNFMKKLFIGISLLAFLAMGLYVLWATWTYSDGTRAGDLIKISTKGYIFKTHEGQLKLGGIDLQNQDEGLSDTWSFSVKDDKVYRELEKLQGKKVVLRYQQVNRAMPWQGDTEYFIYKIEEVIE